MGEAMREGVRVGGEQDWRTASERLRQQLDMRTSQNALLHSENQVCCVQTPFSRSSSPSPSLSSSRPLSLSESLLHSLFIFEER